MAMGKKNYKKKRMAWYKNDISSSRVIKRKRVIVDEEYDAYLCIKIHHVEGIDNLSVYPYLGPRFYYTVFWVKPENQMRTYQVKGTPNPVWDWSDCILLDKEEENGLLSLEVIRVQSTGDPGTSNGVALVGRAQIPLPKPTNRKVGRFGLVRLDGPGYRPEGHIALSMEVKMVVKGHSPTLLLTS